MDPGAIGRKFLLQNSNGFRRINGIIPTNGEALIDIPGADIDYKGCLIFLYHPYTGTGMYLVSPYEKVDMGKVSIVKEATGANVSISKNKLHISASQSGGYKYSVCLF